MMTMVTMMTMIMRASHHIHGFNFNFWGLQHRHVHLVLFNSAIVRCVFLLPGLVFRAVKPSATNVIRLGTCKTCTAFTRTLVWLHVTGEPWAADVLLTVGRAVSAYATTHWLAMMTMVTMMMRASDHIHGFNFNFWGLQHRHVHLVLFTDSAIVRCVFLLP